MTNMLIRVDGWEREDDKLLVSTVLEYIRSGKTQEKAFETAGKSLRRTAAACGFRWNSRLRKKNNDAYLEAKNERLGNVVKKKPIREIDRLKIKISVLVQKNAELERELSALRRPSYDT